MAGGPEASVVQRAEAGDADAFWALVEPHDRALRGLAYRLLGDRGLMDDALQEAYLKAFRALPSFRGEATLASWLYRVVYNTCLDLLRRASRRTYVPLESVREPLDPRPDPADVAAHRGDLAAALHTLSPDQRAAVLLVDAHGMDYGEAAEILGTSRGTVASRLSRARSRLRAVLGETEGGRRS